MMGVVVIFDNGNGVLFLLLLLRCCLAFAAVTFAMDVDACGRGRLAVFVSIVEFVWLYL